VFPVRQAPRSEHQNRGCPSLGSLTYFHRRQTTTFSDKVEIVHFNLVRVVVVVVLLLLLLVVVVVAFTLRFTLRQFSYYYYYYYYYHYYYYYSV